MSGPAVTETMLGCQDGCGHCGRSEGIRAVYGHDPVCPFVGIVPSQKLPAMAESYQECGTCRTHKEHELVCMPKVKAAQYEDGQYNTYIGPIIDGLNKPVNYAHADFHVKITDEAKKLGELLSEKNKAYGNSFQSVPAIIHLLYPNGISGEAVEDALLIVRVLDKLQRIANNNDPFGENPWLDVAGYALLRVATKEKK